MARMRTGEPAATFDEAQLQLAVADRMRRQWWSPLVPLLSALVWSPIAITGHGLGGRWLPAFVLVNCLVAAAWAELNRRGALRAIDANRRRWPSLEGRFTDSSQVPGTRHRGAQRSRCR